MEYPPFVPIGQEQFPAKDFVGQGRVETWVPVLTFGTPGNLSIAYSFQVAEYVRLGQLIVCYFHIKTSTFTHTTSVGGAVISGLPFIQLADPADNSTISGGTLTLWSGITNAGYTQMGLIGEPLANISGHNGRRFGIQASGSGLTSEAIEESHMPSGGTVELKGIFVNVSAAIL